MRQHHALRCAAGAGGVDQAGQGLAVDIGRFGRDIIGGLVVGDQAVPGGGAWDVLPWHGLYGDQQIEPAGLRGGFPHPSGQGSGGDNGDADAGIAQHMGVIGHRVGGVGRHRHGADGQQGGFGNWIFRPIFRDNQHPIPGLHPGRAQPACDAGGLAGEVAPGDAVPRPAAPGAQHRPVRPGFGAVEHHDRQV